MEFKLDKTLQKLTNHILLHTEFPHIKPEQIRVIRSHGSRSRAYARIWAFPSIWQVALGFKPHYVIEAISEHFDRLSPEDQTKTLIHELLHIPKTFSGALRPHHMRHFHLHREVKKYFEQYKNSTKLG